MLQPSLSQCCQNHAYQHEMELFLFNIYSMSNVSELTVHPQSCGVSHTLGFTELVASKRTTMPALYHHIYRTMDDYKIYNDSIILTPYRISIKISCITALCHVHYLTGFR